MKFKLSAPIEVRLEITRQCNLKCIHCYNSSGKALPNELTYSEITDIVDQLERMKVFDVVLEGGEIFLRNDIWDILNYIKGKFKIGIITNGTCLNRDNVKKLVNIVDYVQVSIDGARPSTNDFLRGRGTFKVAINAVKLLVSTGIPVSISMVLTRQNINEIEEYIRLAKKLNVYCAFSRLQLTGRAKENRDILEIPQKEFIKAVKTIVEVSKWYPDVHVQVPLYCFPFLIDKRYVPLFSTSLANIECTETLSILANGDVVPCLGLPIVVGNVRRKTLPEIWENSPILNQLRRIYVKGKCGTCIYQRFCRGGCRGHAYIKTGKLDVPDPLCWHGGG